MTAADRDQSDASDESTHVPIAGAPVGSIRDIDAPRHRSPMRTVERARVEARAQNDDEMAQARSAATMAVVDAQAEKKLVIAGPGTGKTYTFERALQGVVGKGLALTFIRNLVSDLEQALGDLADVFTFHGFCKRQMHLYSTEGLVGDLDYYPPFLDLVVGDLRLLGRSDVEKGDVEHALHNLDDSDGLISDTLRLGDLLPAGVDRLGRDVL